MRWPWQHRDEPTDQPDPQGAKDRLDEIKRQRPQVHALASALREERRRNHFGESAKAIFLGGDGR